MWNRECLDLAILTAQIIGRNCFMEAVSMPRAWWHSPQRLSLRPAIPPTQNSKNRRGETEMAERTTWRKFAKECVSVSTHLIDRRPTARNPTPSLNLGLFSNFAVLYCFEQLDSWWNKKKQTKAYYTFTMLRVGLLWSTLLKNYSLDFDI